MVDVDIDHIMENHHPSGGKGPNKDKFPKWMTGPMIIATLHIGHEWNTFFSIALFRRPFR